MYFDPDSVANRLPDALFESLVGGTYDFYGVDDNCFCIGVNGARIAIEAVEDPSDGYRSYFGCFRTEEVGKIFFGQPIARVRLETGGLSSRTYCHCKGTYATEACSEHHQKQIENFNGWILRDVDNGHVWLQVGTDHGDDYYPCFTFSYEPDTSKQIEISHD